MHALPVEVAFDFVHQFAGSHERFFGGARGLHRNHLLR